MTTAPVPDFSDEFSTHIRLIGWPVSSPIANKGDHSTLSDAASILLEAFVRHAEDERFLVLRLPPFTARLVENGQQRVVDRLVSLVLEADLAEQPCRCSELAEEVASLIEMQIVSEEWDQTGGLKDASAATSTRQSEGPGLGRRRRRLGEGRRRRRLLTEEGQTGTEGGDPGLAVGEDVTVA